MAGQPAPHGVIVYQQDIAEIKNAAFILRFHRQFSGAEKIMYDAYDFGSSPMSGAGDNGKGFRHGILQHDYVSFFHAHSGFGKSYELAQTVKNAIVYERSSQPYVF